MVHVRSLSIGPIATNCYIVHNDKHEAFIIDPGYEYEPILAATEDFRVSHILLTHGHFDHIGGVAAVKESTGAQVLIHSNEKEWLTDPDLNLSHQRSEYTPWEVTGPAPDRLISDHDALDLLGERIEVVFTPGHSPGHVSFLMGDLLFGGDALFAGSIGRTDLPGGHFDTLIQSIKDRIFTLAAETTVLPGHGPATTVGREKESNPFLL